MRNTIEYIQQDFKCRIAMDLSQVSHAENFKDIDESARKNFNYANTIKLVSGKNCCPETAFNEFVATKKQYGKETGIFFYQYDQSFKPDENISPQTAHEIALKFAKDNYKDFEVVVATHIDRAHIHSHFLINSVSFETGKKLHQGKDTIKKLREYSDGICQQYGLSTLPKYEQGTTKTLSSKEYRVAAKGESWKFKLMNAIDECMKRSRTKEQFIKNMQNLDYSLKWTDGRKSITYHCPNNKDCRDIKLHENKYLKGNMENEFRFREFETEKHEQGSSTNGAASADSICDSAEAMGGNREDITINGKAICKPRYEDIQPTSADRLDELRQPTTGGQQGYNSSIGTEDEGSRQSTSGYPKTGWEDTRENLFKLSSANREYFQETKMADNKGVRVYGTGRSVTLDVLRFCKAISKIGSVSDDLEEFASLALITGLTLISAYALYKIITKIPENKIVDEFLEKSIEELKEQKLEQNTVQDFDLKI